MLNRLYQWKKLIPELEKQARNPITARKFKRRPLGVGCVLDMDVELGLAKWIIDQRNEGIPVTKLMLTLFWKSNCVVEPRHIRKNF